MVAPGQTTLGQLNYKGGQMEWYEKNKERFLIEKKLFRRHYPQAIIIINNKRVIVFKKVLGKKHSYLIKIVYPRDFPNSQPRAYIVKPHIKKVHHQFSDSELCLYDSREVGPQTSGKVICDWCVRWIKAYEVWLSSGKWPKPKDTEAKWIKLR